jgi:hypothetical protein
MAVIISSHRTTVAMMNSIHTLLSENHPCTLFMASLLPATMLHPTKYIITSTVDDGAEPYSYLGQRPSRDNQLCCNDNLKWPKLAISLAAAKALGLKVPDKLLALTDEVIE